LKLQSEENGPNRFRWCRFPNVCAIRPAQFLGGLKVVSGSGWFAARLLLRILEETQMIVSDTLAASSQ
jgi:hypothetical protein